MRAADPVENSGSADVVRIDGPAHRHHAPPVYARRDDDAATATLSLNVDLRGWPAQLAQWLMVLGVLGLLIGGAKWWSNPLAGELGSAAASPSTMASTPPGATRAARSGAPPAASSSPAIASAPAPTPGAPGVAAATKTGMLGPAPAGGEQRATECTTQT